MDLFYVFVSGYEFRRLVYLVSFVLCICFRIRAQGTRKPCYLILVLF